MERERKTSNGRLGTQREKNKIIIMVMKLKDGNEKL